MGAFTKTFAAKLMHQEKTLLQNGCIKSLSFTKFRKRIILFLKVSLHVMKVSLLMWFSLSLISSQSKLSLNFEANAADQWKDPFLVLTRPFFSRSLPSEAGRERERWGPKEERRKKLGPFPSLPPRAQSFLPVLTRAEKGYRKEGGRGKRGEAKATKMEGIIPQRWRRRRSVRTARAREGWYLRGDGRGDDSSSSTTTIHVFCAAGKEKRRIWRIDELRQNGFKIFPPFSLF